MNLWVFAKWLFLKYVFTSSGGNSCMKNSILVYLFLPFHHVLMNHFSFMEIGNLIFQKKCKNLDSILIFEFPSHAMIQNVQIHFA